jgi:hypothetical protein
MSLLSLWLAFVVTMETTYLHTWTDGMVLTRTKNGLIMGLHI